MGAVRGTLAVVLAFLLQRGLLAWFPVWGVSPWLLPSVVCLLGLFQGADRGAGYGLLGGFLCLFSGASPWVLALLPLMLRQKSSKIQGAALLVAYAVYLFIVL